GGLRGGGWGVGVSGGRVRRIGRGPGITTGREGKASPLRHDRSARGWTLPASAVVSGVLFALAFPPLEWVLLLPVAPVPWLVALAREESRGRALLSGFLFGMAYWCASIPWIVYVVTHYGGQGSALRIVCLPLLAAILSEWPAFVAWGTAAFAPPRPAARPSLFPLLWLASELARPFLLS